MQARRASDRLLLFYLSILCIFICPSHALHRTIGPAGSPQFRNATQNCPVDDPKYFKINACSKLITCVYENLSEAMKASLGSGTSIAALLPTILALIGSAPLELVQLAITSPHRALATCCFTIGLPSGLFRQLRPYSTQLSQSNPRAPRVREWTIPLPTVSERVWKNLFVKIGIDLVVIGLAIVMLWRNWVVNSFTMIPWRCEYSYLLFAWPIACMLWLLIAIGLLHTMKESLEVYDYFGKKLDYGIIDLITLPYNFERDTPHRPSRASASPVPPPLPTVEPTKTPATNTTSDIPLSAVHTPSIAPLAPSRSDTMESYRGEYIRVCITMPTNFGVRSWRIYEAAIESIAVGIYLYATFVLTSTMFLNADHAIVFATVMTVCLSSIRVLTMLF
ncbi:hypothetical protein K491DRAFT_720253 [Lophiostoma macrostomum CBS 122681]|uniref:Uncharacterized protein n=1 Tax=Lophiostoma macrostomum CBS 122681 TaxID=1314788 RepID=A0A6A6ST91_9PLEO|nr:hypothetical protein K491DRAFT_720253 [Lophiostoma macrostomum CBS 122681]